MLLSAGDRADHVWLLICQGFAQHVNQNRETLRHQFVQHEGKQRLEVVRSNFRKGAPENDWAGVVADFSRQMKARLQGDIADLLTRTYSTSGPVDELAFGVSMMDAFQAYFKYIVPTWGVASRSRTEGIPTITLEGAPADWRSILERSQRLNAFGLDWWLEGLVPILEELVRTSEGQIRPSFWQQLYKAEDGKSGWWVNFFPYVYAVRWSAELEWVSTVLRSPHLTDKQSGSLTLEEAGSGLSFAPFTWECLEATYKMEFAAGFVGITQDPMTKALRPEIGWAVCEAAHPSDD